MQHRTLAALLALWCLLSIALIPRGRVAARQPGLSVDSKTLLSGVGTGISGNISATYVNVTDAKEFAIFFQSNSNPTDAKYRVDYGTSVDGVNFAYEPTGVVTNNVSSTALHYAVITPCVCYAVQVKITDLASTQGNTPTVIIVSR